MRKKETKKDFLEHLTIAIAIYFIYALIQSLRKPEDFYFDFLGISILITTGCIVLGGFSFYFNNFNKDKFASEVSIFLTIVGILIFSAIQFSGEINWFVVYLGLLMLAFGFFLSGIIVYGASVGLVKLLHKWDS